jgi:hypothetical protein
MVQLSSKINQFARILLNSTLSTGKEYTEEESIYFKNSKALPSPALRI